MGSMSYAELVEEWDPVPVWWSLMCHRHAAVRLLKGQTPRRVAPVPAPDVGHAARGRSGGWGAVSAELALRTGLAELSAALGVTVTGVRRATIHIDGRSQPDDNA